MLNNKNIQNKLFASFNIQIRNEFQDAISREIEEKIEKIASRLVVLNGNILINIRQKTRIK